MRPLAIYPCPQAARDGGGEPELAGPNGRHIRVNALEYNTVLDANESDHKPVYAVLSVEYDVVDQASGSRGTCSLRVQGTKNGYACLFHRGVLHAFFQNGNTCPERSTACFLQKWQYMTPMPSHRTCASCTWLAAMQGG
jgi:hypothetical protein